MKEKKTGFASKKNLTVRLFVFLLFLGVSTIIAYPQFNPSKKSDLDFFQLDLYDGWGSKIPEGIKFQHKKTVGNHIYYQQMHNGIPIYGTQIIDEGEFKAFRIFPAKKLPQLDELKTERVINKDTALEIARQNFPPTDFALTGDLYFYPCQRGAYLLWIIVEKRLEEPYNPNHIFKEIWIDAFSGDVYRISVGEDSSMPKSGDPVYWEYLQDKPLVDSSGDTKNKMSEIPEGLECPPPAGPSGDPPWRAGYGYGNLVDGLLLCFPAKIYDNSIFFYHKLIAYFVYEDSKSVIDTVKTYQCPPPSTNCSIRNTIRFDVNIPDTPNNSNIFNQPGEDDPTVIDLHRNTWRVYEFWADMGASPGDIRYWPDPGDWKPVKCVFQDIDNTGNPLSYEPDYEVIYANNRLYPGATEPAAAAVDAIAHEYGHGILEHARGPFGIGLKPEAKALEEGFADIMAMLAESYIKYNSQSIDWRIGEDLGVIIRNLERPPDSGHSDNYFEFRVDPGTQDYHRFATIVGLAFRLLVEENAAIPRPQLWPGPPVDSLGKDIAGDIFYKAYTKHFTDPYTFPELEEHCIQEAKKAYPELQDFLEKSIRDAFRAVGVVSDKIDCLPGEWDGLKVPNGIIRYLYVPLESFIPSVSKIRFEAKSENNQAQFKVIGKRGYYPYPTPGGFEVEVDSTNGTAVLEFVPEPPGDLLFPDEFYFGIEAFNDNCDEIRFLVDIITPDVQELQNGVPLPNQSGGTGQSKYYKINLPENPEDEKSRKYVLMVDTEAGTGNTNLYVKHGKIATPDDYDYCSPGPGTQHSIEIDQPAPGDWFFCLFGTDNFKGVTIRAYFGEDILPPTADRTDDFYPTYFVGETSVLEISTYPLQPYQMVYRHLPGQPTTSLQETDGQGRLHMEQVWTAADAGTYSDERFSVGSTDNPKSSPLAYTVSVVNAPTASADDSFYPAYMVGDTAVLHVTTAPPQPGRMVYQHQPGQPLLTLGKTDAQGSLTRTTLLTAAHVGTYTNLQYSVGGETNPLSSPLNYTISPVNAPTAQRSDPYYPNYQVGQTAVLNIATNPAQPGRMVYRHRLGEPITPLDETDAQGCLTRSSVLTAGDIGTYIDERFSVGSPDNPRSAPGLNYIVTQNGIQPPTVQRPDGFYPNYFVGDIAILQLTTNPAQPYQTVYRHRQGEPVTALEETDGQGRLTRTITLTGSDIGSFTNERFSVGDPDNPKSSPGFNYTVTYVNRPGAQRTDPHYPNYRVGDTAVLEITSNPVVPGRMVYRFRDGEPVTPLEETNAQGRLIRTIVLTSDDVGTYSNERFSIGSPDNPRSHPSLNYTVSHLQNPPTVSRPDGFYPTYFVGDTAVMQLSTNPAQPFQMVYRHRVGEPVTALEETDAQGRLTRTAVLASDDVGIYTGERFSVGSPDNPTSSSFNYRVFSVNAPSAQRTDSHYPNYQVGDTAVLEITTNPAMPGRMVYRYRDGEPMEPLVETDAQGRLTRTAVLTVDDIGTYSNERFSIGHPGNPTSIPLNYTVSSAADTVAQRGQNH